MMGAEEVKVGSFQVVLLFLLGVNFVTVSMNHALPGFHSYTPNFYCKVKGSVNSTNTCITQSEIPAATNSTNLPSESGAEYSSCETGYRFDSVRGETTIVTEWGLICEKKYLLPLSNILYLSGVLIGAWIAGVLADRVGRLPVLAICLYTQGTLAVALYIIQDYRAFLVVRCLQGIFVQGLQISTYALLFELFPVRTRTLVGMTSRFSWAIGLALLAGLSYAVADWRVLQLATSVPTAITVLYIWIIPESPRWLLAKGKLTEAHMALEKIAKYNTCCRKKRVQVQIQVEDANATTITENVTPVKPKRKSRVSNLDPDETKTADDALPEESANLLASLDSSEDKNIEQNRLLTPSESLERRISDLELQLELDMSHNEPKNDNTEAATPPIAPSPDNENCRLSKSFSGNQEVLPDVIDEVVELRVTGMVPTKKEEVGKADVADSEEKKNQDVERKTETANNQSFVQLLRHPKLRRSFMVMIFVWLSVSLCHSGWVFHLPSITNGDRHVNFVICASLDLAAYGLTYLILIKFGRRIPLSISLILSGAICIIVGAISMPIHEDGLWTRPTKLTLILVGKGATVSSFAIAYLYTAEIFPTILRGTSLGYCEISNNIGSLIAPQILMLGAKTSVAVPISIMGTLCVVSGILSLALPETLDKSLPDTIEQSANLFRKYRKKSDLDDDQSVRKNNNKRQTGLDEQTERDILREKLFSDENGGKTWVDAGNGIIVNFSDSNCAKNAE